jgi:NitT/TauT family transport system ATP-binding protein
MAIELVGISKSYDNKHVLHSLDLTITPGEITFVMGASGIGKTTLINIVAGLVKPDAGEIFGLTEDKTEKPLRNGNKNYDFLRNKKISIVFQEDRLLEWETALTNVLFVKNPARDYTDKAKQLLTQAGLGDSIYKKAAELSGGMKRRVCICRALIADYDLLILDEPFKGLDSETKPIIMNMLKEHLREDKYVLCVTHDISEVEFFGGRPVTIKSFPYE